jgi:hypothetical protein
MKLTGKNRQLGEKPVPVPLCPPQIPYRLTPGSNPGLRSGTMARPFYLIYLLMVWKLIFANIVYNNFLRQRKNVI